MKLQLPFMKRILVNSVGAFWLPAVWWIALSPEAFPAETNAPAITVDALVAEVLSGNPELNFYNVEIAAARGERRAAGVFANPELSGTLGDKRVRDALMSGEGLA